MLKWFKGITPAGFLALLTLLILLIAGIFIWRSTVRAREQTDALRESILIRQEKMFEIDRHLSDQLSDIRKQLAKQDSNNGWLYGEVRSLSTKIGEVEKAVVKMPKLPPAMRWSFGYEPPPVLEDDEVEIERVSKVILHYAKKAPRRKLVKNEEYRREFATDIFHAATGENVPHIFVAMQAFKESSYRTEAVGGRGEIGLMQVHGKAAEGCNLSSRLGQLQCGSRWLATAYKKCGDWQGAISAYASGSCKPQSREVWDLVTERLSEWMELESSL